MLLQMHMKLQQHILIVNFVASKPDNGMTG